MAEFLLHVAGLDRPVEAQRFASPGPKGFVGRVFRLTHA